MSLTAILKVRVDAELLAELERQAARRNRSKSDLARLYLRESIRRERTRKGETTRA